MKDQNTMPLKVWLASFRATLNETSNCDQVGFSIFRAPSDVYLIRIISNKNGKEDTAFWQYSQLTGMIKVDKTKIILIKKDGASIITFDGNSYSYENGFVWFRESPSIS